MNLEIAILSYNRTVELERALSSMETITRTDVTVTVYEDCSPNQNLIEKICEKYKEKLSIALEFKPSVVNLGYDKNLMRALSSESDYVLLLSDDDFLLADYVEETLSYLNRRQPDIAISPFSKRDVQYRLGNHYNGKYTIDVLYDSILFSGLIFKTSIINLSKDETLFLSDSIYTQLYLVGKHWNNSCDYLNVSLIVAGEDGDNYFGLSDATKDKKELVDRSSLMSNLYYQVNMQRVAYSLIDKFHPTLGQKFLGSYSKRLVSHYIKVRLNADLNDYIKSVFELFDIKIQFSRFYTIYIIILVFIPKVLLRPAYKFLLNTFRLSGG